MKTYKLVVPSCDYDFDVYITANNITATRAEPHEVFAKYWDHEASNLIEAGGVVIEFHDEVLGKYL